MSVPAERGRDLDEAVAIEVFGCEGLIEVSQRKGVGPYAKYFTVKPPTGAYNSFECRQRFTRDGKKIYCGKPSILYRFSCFSSDLDACVEVEAEIQRRELVDAYIHALAKVLGTWKNNAWAFRRATPEQICLAALQAVREAKGESNA